MKDSFYTCDLETTGTNPLCSEMVEFYMSHHQGRSLVGELHLKIKPRIWDKQADESVKFHGITREMAMTGTPWAEAMKMIWGFLPEEPSYFICHANRRMFGRQGCFDYQVLSSQFFDAGFDFYCFFQKIFPPRKIISTHSMAKMLMGSSKNDLKEVTTALGINLKDHHTAKNDAEAAWKIFQKLRKKIDLEKFCLEDYEHQTATTKTQIKELEEIITRDDSHTQGEEVWLN